MIEPQSVENLKQVHVFEDLNTNVSKPLYRISPIALFAQLVFGSIIKQESGERPTERTHYKTRIIPMAKSVSFLGMAMLIAAILSGNNVVYGSEYDKGKALYEEKCMICHGANGKGNGPAAMALSPPPKNFNSPEFWNQKNVDQIITNQVINGKGSMPAMNLNEDEIKEIINFMSHTFKKSN